jgi:D-alanyl-D-alanine carboxypeptidase (penicillin-binding protein 5/6)
MVNQWRNIVWYNTNKLLNLDGFIGVKTGATPSAGPCLSSVYRMGISEYIVIVVLKTSTM